MTDKMDDNMMNDDEMMNDSGNFGGMMDKAEMQELMSHLQNHIMYPASKRTIVESCNKMEHVPESVREWTEQKLPDGTYMSADEVVMKLGM
jgi:hypothetical protein